MEIRDIINPWRQDLMPASFRNAQFHVEVGSKESGRRIVVHEFPKRDLPYSEDMGRKAIEFSVRAYLIQYPRDDQQELYRRDYRIARDRLIRELEREGDGMLQLPLLPPLSVVVQRYRITEEERFGGFCTFDMTFVEFGRTPTQQQSTREALLSRADALDQLNTTLMNEKPKQELPSLMGQWQLPGISP